jgi:hypothetical protein
MMMVAGLGRTEQAAAGVGWALLMPMAMLGGAMMPQGIMPPWLQTIGQVSPIKWAILGIEGAVWRASGIRRDTDCEAVADFTDGENMCRPCRIVLELTPQFRDVGIDGAGDNRRTMPPHFAQEIQT